MHVSLFITDRIRASLIAGAIGDSFGAAVEVQRLPQILEQYGPSGVTDLLSYNPNNFPKWAPCGQTGIGVVTDDTSMMAATAAGLLKAHAEKADEDRTLYMLHQSFLRWGQHQAWVKVDYAAYLDPTIAWPDWFDAFCFASGAGKNTIAALDTGKIGTIEQPLLLHSHDDPAVMIATEGCGGMMRVAPVGWFGALGIVTDTYRLGCRSAAITHSGPVAQTASGALAILIEALLKNASWSVATQTVLENLSQDPHATTTIILFQSALKTGHERGISLSFDDIETLPFTTNAARAENRKDLFLSPSVLVQAIAIAAASQEWSLPPQEKLRHAFTLAATQSGDSDSVAAIVGNILGAQLGPEAIPTAMAAQLQSLPALASIAQDLAALTSIAPYSRGMVYHRPSP